MKQLIFFALFLLAAAAVSADAVETREFNASTIKSLTVNNLSGDVFISATSGKLATIKVTKIEFDQACSLTVAQNGSALKAQVERPGILSNKSCKVRFDIAVPAKTAVTVAAASSDIEIDGMTGDLSFQTASGSISGKSELTAVTGSTSSGDIELKDIAGPADIRTSSGDILLSYKRIPAKGGIDLRTSSGSSEIILPRDSKISTEFFAASGRLKNMVGDSPKASFRISGRSASGDLTIKQATF